MNILCRVIMLVVLVLGSTLGFAKTSEWQLSDAGMDYALTQFGASYQVKGHSLIILIDQSIVLTHLDEQMRNGYYNSDYSKSYIVRRPLAYFTVSALNASTYIIPRVYQDHPSLNYLNVSVRIKYENVMGNDVTGSLLSFSMSRNLSNQINWIRFMPANFGDVYPNIRFSNLTLREFYREKI